MARTLSSLALLLVLLGGLFYLVIPAREPRPQLTRQEFADRFLQIQEGMTQNEVLAILGKPDDILTEVDPVRFSSDWDNEIWGYGTRWHLETPSLGSLEFDFDQKVSYRPIREGTPPRKVISPTLIPEKELRNLFDYLNQISGSSWKFEYDPLTLIHAVNAFHTLGKEKALAVLEEHHQVTGNQGDFLVLLALFEPPSESIEQLPGSIGLFSQKEILTRFPRYPIHLLDDVPLLIRPEKPIFLQGNLVLNPLLGRNPFHYFRENGKFRTTPLAPSGNPFNLMKKWESQTKGLYGPEEYPETKNIIARQIIQLTATIHGKDYPNESLMHSPQYPYSVELDNIVKDQPIPDFFWDSLQNHFTFYDGSYNPIIKPKKYRSYVIYFDDLSGFAKLTLSRINKNRVQFWFSWRSLKVTKIQDIEISVFQEKDKKRLFQPDLTIFQEDLVKKTGWTGSMGSQEELDLPQGESVTVTIQLNGQTKTISGLKP